MASTSRKIMTRNGAAKFSKKTTSDPYPPAINSVTVEKRTKRDVLLKIYRADNGSILVDLRSWGVRADGGMWPEAGIRVPWKSYADLFKEIFNEYVKDRPSNIEMKIKVPGCAWAARFHCDVITDPGPGPAQAHGTFRHVHIDTPTEPLWLSPNGLRFLMQFEDGLSEVLGDQYAHYLNRDPDSPESIYSEVVLTPIKDKKSLRRVQFNNDDDDGDEKVNTQEQLVDPPAATAQGKLKRKIDFEGESAPKKIKEEQHWKAVLTS